MEEKNTKFYKILFIIGCIVLVVALSFGAKSLIDYKNNEYKEERPYGASSTVTITGSSSVTVGSAITLTATASDGAPVSWSSGDTSIATVSGGTVTGKSAGTVVITASTASGASATHTVTVNAATTVTLSSISVSPSSVTLNLGSSRSLVVTASYSDGSTKTVTSSATFSGFNSYVTNPAQGYVKGAAVGSASISISYTEGSISKTTSCSVSVVLPCSVGEYSDSGTCTTCPVGYSCNGATKSVCSGTNQYQDQTGQSTCKTCSGVVDANYTACRTVSISGSSSVYVGRTITLTATTSDSTSVTWSSSDTSVATVSSSGVVTGVKGGSVTITAKSTASHGASITKTITVNNTPCSSGQYVGSSGSCETCPAGYSCDGISKNACDGTNEYQNLTGQSTCKTCSGGTVNSAHTSCDSALTVTISGATTVVAGNTITLTATVTPSGTPQTVTWSSSRTAVATINGSGVVTAVKPGTTVITATSVANSSEYDTHTVNVVCPTGQYNDNGTCTTCPAGSSCSDGLTKNVCNGTNQYQDQTGQSTCKTCSDGVVDANYTACRTVSIAGSSSVYVGRTISLSATTSDSSTVTWSSSDDTIATVSSAGVVTGVKGGSVTITAKSTASHGASKTKTITVNNTPCSSGYYMGSTGSCVVCPVGYSCDGIASTACSGTNEYQNKTGQSTCKTCSGTVNSAHTSCDSALTVTISGETKVVVGNTITLTATVTPSGTPQTVTWASSRTAVATVNSLGLVTAVKPGTAVITATSVANSSEYDTHTVNVVCPTGQYNNNGTCTACPVGHYCSDGLTKKACDGTAQFQDETGQSTCKTLSVTCSLTSIYPGIKTSCIAKSNNVAISTGVTYSSNNQMVASVNSSTGEVTGNSTGTATITATYSGASVTQNISVGIRPTVTLTCTKTLLGSGETSTCTTKVNGVTQTSDVTYTSSKTSVARVSTTGVVSAINAGETVITATYNGIEATVTMNVMMCSLGYWRGQNSCEVCPAGYYCADGLTKETCPTGKTSSLGAKSADDCYVKANDSECTVSTSIASKRVSIDKDGLSENSYYAVKVTVTGNGCNGQKLTYTATNAKSISPTTVSNISSGSTYYFNVYPKEACSSSTAKATLTNGTSSSSTVSTIFNDWTIENGCWTTSQVLGKAIGSHTADKEALNEYYDDYDSTKQCYTVHAYRVGCGSSDPSDEEDTPEVEACYMNNSSGVYIWGKYKNDSNYTLISDKTSKDACKPSTDGGYGAPIYACYKDSNNNFKWDVTAPDGYTLVESVKDEANCKLNDNAACYRDSDGKYRWGDYSNNSSYTLIESIKTYENCNTPNACYKNASGEFVWGNYAYNSSYSLVANINNQSDCSETVKVPSTAASTSAIIYISVITMLIFGGSVVYYVYYKKKVN